MKKSPLLLIALVIIVLIGGVSLLTRSRTTPLNTQPINTVPTASQTSLSAEEETQILAASDQIVKANTEVGYTYTMAIKKHVDDYVRVDVTPGKGEMIDPAQVILQKENGVWKALMFGTSFPDMYDKVPGLFE